MINNFCRIKTATSIFGGVYLFAMTFVAMLPIRIKASKSYEDVGVMYFRSFEGIELTYCLHLIKSIFI